LLYATCTHCGKWLFRGGEGTNVEMICTKCGSPLTIIIENGQLMVMDCKDEQEKVKVDRKKSNRAFNM